MLALIPAFSPEEKGPDPSRVSKAMTRSRQRWLIDFHCFRMDWGSKIWPHDGE